MLGVALLHLLPHSIYILKDPSWALGICLIGLLFMFFMVRMFHFHQHDLAVDSSHEHLQKKLCDHKKDQHHVHCDHHDGRLDLSWAGLCFGLAVHTIIDGIALAAAVQSSSPTGLSFAGLGVFLAIVLHKPLDALSITSLMAVRMGRDETVNGQSAFRIDVPAGSYPVCGQRQSDGGLPRRCPGYRFGFFSRNFSLHQPGRFVARSSFSLA